MEYDRFDRPTEIRRGRPEEQEAIIDFADFVFSRAHRPHDFASLLPKLYGPEVNTAHEHLLVTPRDSRDLLALLYSGDRDVRSSSAWQLDAATPLAPFKVNGIGTVSVHPRERGKSYMRRLMRAAIDEMQAAGVTFSALGGQRQRYAYYGYEPAGYENHIFLSRENLSKSFGRQCFTDPSLGEVTRDPAPVLSELYAIYEASHPWLARTPEDWLLISGSWDGRRIYVYRQDGVTTGYLIAEASGNERQIQEFAVTNPDDTLPFLTAFMGAEDIDNVYINLPIWQSKLATLILDIAEGYRITAAVKMLVLDWCTLLRQTLELQAQLRGLNDGQLRLRVTDQPEGLEAQDLLITVTNEKPQVQALSPAHATTASIPTVTLSYSRAVRYLWSPAAQGLGRKRHQTMSRDLPGEEYRLLNTHGWFPLPFAYLPADRV